MVSLRHWVSPPSSRELRLRLGSFLMASYGWPVFAATKPLCSWMKASMKTDKAREAQLVSSLQLYIDYLHAHTRAFTYSHETTTQVGVGRPGPYGITSNSIISIIICKWEKDVWRLFGHNLQGNSCDASPLWTQGSSNEPSTAPGNGPAKGGISALFAGLLNDVVHIYERWCLKDDDSLSLKRVWWNYAAGSSLLRKPNMLNIQQVQFFFV